MKNFYYLVIAVIVIRLFVFLTSSTSHPVEDYLFTVVAGLIFILAGALIHFLYVSAKKLVSKLKK